MTNKPSSAKIMALRTRLLSVSRVLEDAAKRLDRATKEHDVASENFVVVLNAYNEAVEKSEESS